MSLTALAPALSTTFSSHLVRAWNRSSVFLQNVTVVSGGGQGGGKQVGWDVQFSGATAYGFAEGADVAVGEFANDTEVPATIAWGQYRASFSLSNLEMNAAYASIANAAELDRILEERFFDALAKITSTMNADVISGQGVRNDQGGTPRPAIFGLTYALAASGTYANIAKGTYSEWAGNVAANGGVTRPLSLDLLARAEQTQYVASAQSAGMVLTTPGVKTKYEGLFNPGQRLVQGNSGGAIQRMDASAEDLYWRGRPIVRDKDVPTGTAIGVVPSGVELHVLPWAPVDMLPTRMADLISSNGEASKQIGAFVKVYPLAVTGSAVKFVAEIYCQLKVKRPNEHFLIQDIAE